MKRQKKKGGTLLVDLVKLAKLAISPVVGKEEGEKEEKGKGLAEFEVALTNP